MRETFRVKQTTFAILSVDGVRVSITLPINATIVLIAGPLDGNRLVDVEWEGKTVLMFTQDMRDRCEPVVEAI